MSFMYLGLVYINVVLASISLHETEDLANSLQDNFKRFLNEVVHFEKLKQEFVKAHQNKIISIESVDIKTIVDKFSSNLEHILFTNVDSLNKIKEKAEDLECNYTVQLDMKSYEYINTKDDNIQHVVSTFHPKAEVNITHSFVQVPTNIYRADIGILNEAKWTKELNHVFIENRNSSPYLAWQYFGKTFLAVI